MGAAPSGWVAPPYSPAPLAFSGWSAVDLNNPAVNYNNKYALRYTQNGGVRTAELRTYFALASSLAAAIQIRGIWFDGAAPVNLAIAGGSSFGSFTWSMRLYAVQTAFDPATLTWNISTGLTIQQIVAQQLSFQPQTVGMYWPINAGTNIPGLLQGQGAGGVALASITYGFMLALTTNAPDNTLGDSYDTVFFVPAAKPTIANWRIYTT